MKKLVLTVLMCAVMGMPLVYAKDKGADKHGKMMERMMGGGKDAEVFERLNLSADQKKQLEANKKVQMDQVKVLFEQMKTLGKQLNEELMKPQLDMNKVNGINTQIKAVQGKLADSRVNSILEVRKVLKPEQFNKFISLVEEIRSKRMAEHDNAAPKK